MNPELRRNLWIEMTATRLVTMPLVLAAVFFLTWFADGHHFSRVTAFTAIALFTGLTYIWGTRQATESILAEIRDHTWDSQRLSSQSPWSMAFGKLIGSTSYTWYGGLLCLGIYLGAAEPGVTSMKTAGLAVLGGGFVQALGLLAGMQGAIKDRGLSRSQSAVFVFVALGAIWPLAVPALHGDNIQWHSLSVPGMDFALASALVFLLWAWVGVAGQMRTELKQRAAPVVWPAFVTFCIAYCTGFASRAESPVAVPVIGLAVAAGLAYVTLFAEQKDPIALSRLWLAAKARRWQRLGEDLPCWILTLPFVLLGTLWVLSVIAPHAQAKVPPRAAVLAGLFFFYRDLALVLFFNFAKQQRRADMFAVLWLLILYGVAPAIFAVLRLDAVTAIFWPRADFAWVSLAAAVTELGIVAYAMARRWRARSLTLRGI